MTWIRFVTPVWFVLPTLSTQSKTLGLHYTLCRMKCLLPQRFAPFAAKVRTKQLRSYLDTQEHFILKVTLHMPLRPQPILTAKHWSWKQNICLFFIYRIWVRNFSKFAQCCKQHTPQVLQKSLRKWCHLLLKPRLLLRTPLQEQELGVDRIHLKWGLPEYTYKQIFIIALLGGGGGGGLFELLQK